VVDFNLGVAEGFVEQLVAIFEGLGGLFRAVLGSLRDLRNKADILIAGVRAMANVFVSLHSWIRETIVGLSGTAREIGQAIGSVLFRVVFIIVGAKVVKFVAKSLADLKRAV